MWPWKKKHEPEIDRTRENEEALPRMLTGMVYRPPQPHEEQEKQPNPEEKPSEESGEGTIGQAKAVGGGMEHNDTPRNAKSFDPTKADARSLIPLDSVQIATPCRADWDKMQGDEKSRFCQTCQKSVYNLSAMSASDAQKLLDDTGGNLCARIYRREDGTVMTQDCSVGKSEARRPFWWISAGFAALMGLGALLTGGTSSAQPTMGDVASTQEKGAPTAESIPPIMGGIRPMPKPTATPKPKDAQPEMGEPTMGKPAPPAILGRVVCPPTPKPKPTATPEPRS